MDTEVGDYLIIDRLFSDSEPDNDWYECVNLTTGKSGLVPMNDIKRVRLLEFAWLNSNSQSRRRKSP